MIKKIIIIISTLIISSSVYAMENRSKPLQRLIFKVSDFFQFYLENEFYLDYKEIIVDTPALGTDYNLGSAGDFSFEAALIYMHMIDKYFNNVENRIRWSVSGIYNLHGFKIALRGRFEYRIRDRGNALRARPRIKIKTPWKWTKLNFSPYISDELFITEEKFDSQEIEAGFSFGTGNWGFVLANIFVLKEPTKHVENILIIETKYKIDFRGK